MPHIYRHKCTCRVQNNIYFNQLCLNTAYNKFVIFLQLWVKLDLRVERLCREKIVSRPARRKVGHSNTMSITVKSSLLRIKYDL